MRIIAVRTLKHYWEKYPIARQALYSWYEEVGNAIWENPNSLKLHYRNASVITEKRVVFNIHGNSFRLVVDIEYRLQIVFVVWFGTHAEYDKVNVKKLSYVKTN